MASQYTIVQYVPDPVIDERINIGVIVIGEGYAQARFVDNWRRVAYFGSQDSVEFLKDFAIKVREAIDNLEIGQLELDPNATPRRPWLSKEILDQMASRWINSIQLTPLRGSLEQPDALIEQLSTRFLPSPQPRDRSYRDRQQAARIVREHVREAVRHSVGDDATRLLRSNFRVPGRAYFHRVDTVFWNGMPRFAAEGLSFETPDTADRDSHLQLTLWAARDLRDRYENFPFGVMVLTVDESDPSLREAKQAIKTVGATLLKEDEVEVWIAGLASSIADEIHI